MRDEQVLSEDLLKKMMDHTQLKAYATYDDMKSLCDEALKYRFGQVAINSCHVSRCASLLKGSGIKIDATVGFPLGAMSPEAKAFEAKKAVEDGADEIDMVVNIGALKSKDYKLVKEDIEGVVEASKGKLVKVIIEACYLKDEEKVKACELAMEAGAQFVKTSTGFGTGGATVHDVELMRKTVGGKMGVKASGGIRTAEEAIALIRAGATRIGTSNSVGIIEGYRMMRNLITAGRLK